MVQLPSEPRLVSGTLANRCPIAPAIKGCIAAVMAGAGWAWAVTLLATRDHLTANYMVMQSAPPLWGTSACRPRAFFLPLSVAYLAAILAVGLVRAKGRYWVSPVRWLTISWPIPGLDLLRLAGVLVPVTFLEPLLMAGITGAAGGSVGRGVPRSASEGRQKRLCHRLVRGPLAVGDSVLAAGGTTRGSRLTTTISWATTILAISAGGLPTLGRAAAFCWRRQACRRFGITSILAWRCWRRCGAYGPIRDCSC